MVVECIPLRQSGSAGWDPAANSRGQQLRVLCSCNFCNIREMFAQSGELRVHCGAQ